MERKQRETKKKQAYEKPILRAIKIAEGQQTTGVGCKLRSAGASKPGAAPCTANLCALAGS